MGNTNALESDKEDSRDELNRSFLGEGVPSSSTLNLSMSNQFKWENYDEYILLGVHVYNDGRMVRMNDTEQTCIIATNSTVFNAIDLRNRAVRVFEWEVICHKIGNCSRIGFIRCDYSTQRRCSLKQEMMYDILGNDIDNHFGIVLKENENKIVNISTHETRRLKSKYFRKPRLKNGDRFRFRLDFESNTVSLKWNEDELGVIYSNIDFPIMPAVSKSGGTAEYELNV